MSVKPFGSWLSTDGKLIIVAKGVRAFGFGSVSVILFIYLNSIGLDVILDGLIFSLIMLSGALFTVVGSLYAERLGRRLYLIVLALLMTMSGLMYATTTNLALLIIASLIGALSASGGDVGSFQSIEQAALPQTCSKEKRNSTFAVYNLTGRLGAAAGALFSGLPTVVNLHMGSGIVGTYRPLFLSYAVVALVTSFIYAQLSRNIETPSRGLMQNNTPRISHESRSIMTKLAVLIGVDSFAGGFVLQSIISFWFYTRYHVALNELSLMFFLTGVLSGGAFIISGKLADRLGAINTMVFTHLPSSIFLMLIPFAPTFGLSLAFYLVRQPLSLMDVPARQSYVVSVVQPSERTVASGISNIASNSATAISPSITGFVMQFVSLSIPFYICGILKIGYDLALYRSFRKVKETG